MSTYPVNCIKIIQMQNPMPQKKDYPLLGAGIDFSSRIRLGYTHAVRAADYLKKVYSVKKVFLFGSLVNKKYFHAHSDIDIAVDGLPEESYYQAVGEIMNLIQDFEIDIVDLNTCKPALKKSIMQNSVEL